MLSALRRTSRLAAGLAVPPLPASVPDTILAAGQAAIDRLPRSLAGTPARAAAPRPAARPVAAGEPWRIAA